MEEQRPPKRLRSVAPNQDGHPREPGHSGVEGEDPREADGPAEPGHPSKPFAYVKPMRRETPAFTESAHLAERGRGRQQGRSRRTERGRRRRAGLHRDPGLQAGPGHLPGSGLQAEFDHGEEPAHHVEPDARQTPSFPFTDAATVPGYALQGRSPHTASLGVGLQGLPGAPGYWALVASALSAHIGFRPSAGPALFFMVTSSGTYLCGLPAFFIHTAR
ncbi:proline-rich protein 20E-like [Diceros bicornis minor]|uniref:proline-rich protein 20E-like n=1 Tax=Diceros bicornis minor TaxID=77932 RepID=UPI0026EE2C6A|nr:proline-rich protein 20E-like [Diceros bicornis minor]